MNRPTVKEKMGEVYGICQAGAKNILRKTREVVISYGAGFIGVTLLPYTLPTFVRGIGKTVNREENMRRVLKQKYSGLEQAVEHIDQMDNSQVVRLYREEFGYNTGSTLSDDGPPSENGFFAGVFTSALLLHTPLTFYFLDHPKYILIPLATNMASGIYEIGRSIYKNTKKKK